MKELFFDQLRVVSLFGDNPLVVIAVIAAISYYLFSKKNNSAAIITIMTILSYVYVLFLKGMFKFTRPETAEISRYIGYDIYSFPSTHVVFYTVFWGYIAYLTYFYFKEAALFKHVLRVISFYIILMIGVSRVFLGQHYFKDIIAGYIFGGIFLVLLIWLEKMLYKDFAKDNKNRRKRTTRSN